MPTQSVERAMFILRQFSVDEPQLGVSEVSRRIGLTKSTVSRLLATLREGGLVVQDPISRQYRLGMGLVELGETVVHTDPLLRAVHPYQHYLADAVGEGVYLAVRSGFEMLTLLHERPPDLRDPVPWTSRAPLHCTAGGKILLAHMEEDELTTLLEKGLPRFTGNTITDPAKLRAHLEQVREEGFATCFEEFREGVNSISVPLAKQDGTVVATLGIVGPAYSLTREKAMRSLDTLRGIATEISLKMRPLLREADHPWTWHTTGTNPAPA